jgi:pyruvate/2-oxoglutarate dehydrogenase complex dihydrolipoamide acyltransferase (E2) component
MSLEAVHLPDLGTGPDQPIRISHWYVRPGRVVTEGERLVEVLVGAAIVNVTMPRTGRLVSIERDEDELIEPGGVLGRLSFSDRGSDAPSAADGT